MTPPEALYAEHMRLTLAELDKIFADLSIGTLVLGSGSLQNFFEDDQPHNFRSNHQFAWLCPLEGPEHVIVLQPQSKPHLFCYQPEDYWHEHASADGGFWASAFELKQCSSTDQIWQGVAARLGKKSSRNLYYGPGGMQRERAKVAGLEINDSVLAARMNWQRSFKTDYEIACLEAATKFGADGHQRAKELFEAGASEREIYYGFMQASQALAEELPYTPIIGLDEKAAVLHYHGKRKEPGKGVSMLIDAGVQQYGYACDISRTYAGTKAPKLFQQMVTSLDEQQRQLCNRISLGQNFADIHEECHLIVGQILIDAGVVSMPSAQEAFAAGVTEVFFPHGFGHLLGLFVHDVAGHQLDAQGTMVSKRRFKYLRSYRTVGEGMVFTVEPGIYFIETLLQEARNGDLKDVINWDLVTLLHPCGGIRIEDNVAIVSGKAKNITRQYLA